MAHRAYFKQYNYGDESPQGDDWLVGLDANGDGTIPMYYQGRCADCDWATRKFYVGRKATQEEQWKWEQVVERMMREHREGRRL